MGIFLDLFIFFLVFLVGSISGFIVGIDTVRSQKINQIVSQHFCDSCDCPVGSNEPMFCENCFDDDDKLNSAIKEKELDVRFDNVALRQRNLVNRPDKTELAKLRTTSDKNLQLCDNIRQLGKDLNLKVDPEPLFERNESLRACISKWETINAREEKIDSILRDKEQEYVSEEEFEKNVLKSTDQPFSKWLNEFKVEKSAQKND